MSSLPHKSPKGQSSTLHNSQQDPELTKVISNQLSILISTLTEENWNSNYKQIRYILDSNNNSLIFCIYLEKLFNSVLLSQSRVRNSELSLIERLLKEELNNIAKDLNNLEILCLQINEFNQLEDFNIIDFVDRFEIDLILAFIIVIKFQSLNTEPVKQFIQENSLKLLSVIKTREFPAKFDWTLVLDHILNTPFFPLVNKLLTLSSLKAFKSDIQPVNRFYLSILNMSFKELLLEIGPEHLLPEKLLPSFLQLKPTEIDQSIALILAEILIPGSQGLSNTNGGVTGLTLANNLPEANAKGAQLQACLRSIDSDFKFNIDWYKVFSHVQENLFDSSKRNLQPSVANITQLLSSLDFKVGIIDVFLNFDWWFSKTLLYILKTLDPQQGGYDVTALKNITLCFDNDDDNDNDNDDNKQPQQRRNILRFVNIGKLELLVLTKVSQQNQQTQNQVPEKERKLNIYLSQVFEHDYRVYPEYLIAAALTIVDKNTFIIDLIDTLFTLLMDSNTPALDKVLVKFKELDVQLALNKLIDYYTKRATPEAINKIVKTATKLDLIDELLEKLLPLNFKLGLTFAIDATNYGYDCKPIIQANFQDMQQRGPLCQSLLEILEARATQDYERSQQPQINNDLYKVLRIPVVYYLLENLKSSNGLIDADRLKNLQLLLLTTYPRLINFGCGHDEAILANGEEYNLFPPQVEQEMKSYYSKMYNKEMEIKDIVDMLVRMKVSDNPHDQDVFACMIHSLLDEYRFFSEYPLTALASTSLLFGALLQKDLIQGTTLTVALNFIWESCNQPQDSHLFKFAVQSLYNFKSRLHEYPIYCKHLLECQSLSAHAKMFQIVKDAANGIPCPDSSAPSGSQPQSADGTGASTKTPENSAPLYQSITVSDKQIGSIQQEKPAESISDKLLFFVNNMTDDNLASKLPEIKDLLTENYFLWFANYLVADRAKAEPNNHKLYATLVETLDNAIFYEYVLNFSLKEAEHIIRNFKDSSIERVQLKNLGSWLGKITLANDRPLRRDQIALKFLLVESFDFKSLHLIIPFVCRILDQAQYSKIFNLPNPWLLGIIKVLAELYECADLKLNLKFEIEVLLNVFKKKLKDIEPSTIVRSHNPNPTALAAMFGIRPETVTLTSDMSRLALDSSEPFAPEGPNVQLQQLQLQQQGHAQGVPPALQQARGSIDEVTSAAGGTVPGQNAPTTTQLDTSFSTLIGNTIFTQNPNLRRAFQASLSRAVRECAVPILSRVSEAVLTTTEAMIRKDFACEPDVAKFRKGYQNLAYQLSHSMVVCSGRKILSETIEATMLQLLGNQINPNELPLAELSLAVQSNVDLCVEIVDKIAAGNISELIDEKMQKYILIREKRNPNEPFIEEGTSDYALKLPQPLGLKQDGLNASQLRIYETFGTNGPVANTDSNLSGQAPVQAVASTIPEASPAVMGAAVPVGQLTPQQQISLLQQEDTTASIDQLFTAITQNCEKAIQLLKDAKETQLAELTPEHPIMIALTHALTIAQSNALKYPELLLKAAQYTVNCLFTQGHENPMSNEIYVVVLDKLCEYSPSTAKDVTWWLVHSSDQRKFNMPVIFSLLRVQLVQPIKLDASIGRLINESNSPVVAKFAANLLLNVFSSEELRPIALRSEFGFTLDALSKYDGDDSTEEHKLAKQARDNLFELLDKSALPSSTATETQPELYGQMGYIFAEWIKLLAHGDNSESLQSQFIESLLHNEILTDPDYFEIFFKAATEISVTSFATEHELRTRTQRETYLAVDALAILIVKIVLSFEKEHSYEALEYLKNIIGIVILVLTNDHETFKGSWNERAYFRIFSSLLCTWNDASMLDEKATIHLDDQFYPFIGEVFNSLQPIVYPGFTFAWIFLVSHRMFLPRLLELPERRGYSIVVKLLTGILKFESIYSKDEFVQHDVINVIFKAINRIFTGLAHDYPEFLVECHYQLVTAIPDNYIQLKNIILSATPSNIPVIDPFTQGLKVERLPEIHDSPVIAYKPVEDLVKVGLKKPVDNFLRIPAPALMRSIYTGMKLNHPRDLADFGFDTVHYNVKLINTLVLHVGISAVADRLPNNRGFNTKSSNVTLLVDLMNHGSLEFKFHLINAIANQLRYPNSHTHWFIGIILHFFSSNSIWGSAATKTTVQELITRVLLERHIVNKPHPWGLTIVFTELVKNGDYGFFDLPFVKAAPNELKVVFEALARNVKGGVPLPAQSATQSHPSSLSEAPAS